MKFTRRKLLITTGVVGGGLAIAWFMGRDERPLPRAVADSFQPNAWLELTEDGRVIFQLDKVEMGQGTFTTLPAILAEELDYDPKQIIVEFAPVHPAYNNPAMNMQVTGGSTSVATAYQPLREAGATARWLLLAAAAQRWQVPLQELQTDEGFVLHQSSNRFVAYKDLIEVAKTLPPPTAVSLKDPSLFKRLGKRLGRRDSADKSNGRAQFGVDVDVPGMKIALVQRCPHFGGSVVDYDSEQAEAMAGVIKVFPIHSGVALVADTYWQALQARQQLRIEWDKGELAGLDSEQILARQREALVGDDVKEIHTVGDINPVAADSHRSVGAQYHAPFLHHSTMEPQNCTVLVTADGGRCEIWAPSQSPQLVEMLAAQYGGFDNNKIQVHTTFMGGGFGRRGFTDYVGEAVAIAKELPGVPVKLMWSREDDMRHDFYRPSTLHSLSAVLDGKGKVHNWQHRLVSASVIKGLAATVAASYLPTWLPTALARGIGTLAENFDTSMAEGAEIPYSIANQKLEVALYDPGIPIGFWRSVGHSHNAFVVESFIDELAHAAGRDPVQFRLQYLQNQPRHAEVLNVVAKAAVWGQPRPGCFQGVAVHASFSSYVAEIVEISLTETVPGYRVERVVCAVDCGRALDPDIVSAQIESAINYGLSAALHNPVTIKDGAVVQSNFHDLPVLRITEAPEIEVTLINSAEVPTGVGEIGLPPLAPALANALFAATGQRLRDLPLRLVSGQ